jgi:glycyl-tRNA synthetase
LEEIGVPFAITIDKTSMVDETVTIRDRDTMEQKRISIPQISQILAKELNHYD